LKAKETMLLAVLALGLLGAVTGCGEGDTKTVTETVAGKAASGSEESSTDSATAEEAEEDSSAPKKQVFQGTGQKNLGTIEVPEYATVSWECESCGNTNFIIENSESDPSYFPVNGLEETRGVSALEAGTYHTVVVSTSAGPWTVTIEGE
jgi:hypothetical protein